MIYGTPNPHAIQDSTDLIGIRTLVLRQYWTISKETPSQVDIDEKTPNVPSVPGGVMLMGKQTMKGKGNYATLWTFQGIEGDGKGVTFKSRGKSYDYGFDPGFSQVPIQLHPDFQALLSKYEGYPSNDGTTVIWPTPLSGSGSASTPLIKDTAKKEDNVNPMYGYQAFFEMDGVYRYRYAEKTLPPNLYGKVGQITSDVPGTPPALTDGRTWLKAPPSYNRKGLIFDITEHFWLSRRGGWPVPIYSALPSNSVI